MELDGKKILFTTVKPILELMHINKPGVVIPNEPLVSFLKEYDEAGKIHHIHKRYHNLQEKKYGDTFEEVTDLDIEGQPFTVIFMELSDHKAWYWITARQDVRVAGTGMKFVDPIEIWVSEIALETWADKSHEERQTSYSNDIMKLMKLLDAFTLRPHAFKVTFHYVVDLIKLAMHEHLDKVGYFDK